MLLDLLRPANDFVQLQSVVSDGLCSQLFHSIRRAFDGLQQLCCRRSAVLTSISDRRRRKEVIGYAPSACLAKPAKAFALEVYCAFYGLNELAKRSHLAVD